MSLKDYLTLLLSALAGYLLGSVNTSLIVGKFYGIDVRQHGSGNAGATNTLRTLGGKAAFFTVAGDFLKGVVSCIIGRSLGGEAGLLFAGLGAVAGHNWPVYFKFKGGKGVLTSFAVALTIDWKASVIALVVFLVVVAICRYVSLGSMAGAAVFPFAALLTGGGAGVTLFGALLAVMLIFRHKTNIVRIINGTESKLKFRRK